MTEEPIPCPFCGGNSPIVVKDVQYPDTPNARTWYAVECNKCDATGDWDLSESGAFEKWNTRPVEDALRAENERLRNLLLQADEWLYYHLDRCALATETGTSCTCGYAELQQAIDALPQRT